MEFSHKSGAISIIKIIKSIGVANIFRAILFARYRDQQDRSYDNSTIKEPQSPTDIVSTTRLPNGGRFRFVCGQSRIELEINFLAPNLVQVSWGNANEPIPYAIEKKDWPDVNLEHSVSEGEYRISSEALKVIIFPDGGIRFTDRADISLRDEFPPGFQNGKSTHRATLDPDAAIFGLGARTDFNHQGCSYKIWNSDIGGSYGPERDPLYTCLPVYLVITPVYNYLVFYENSSRAQITFSETAEAQFEAGMLRYYFISGNPVELLTRYTELTGKPAMPPRWALGYHQSHWGYKNETDIRKVVREFKQHDMPISAIHLDIDYMQGYRVFTINSDRFPNLKQLSEKLISNNVNIVAIIDPGVKEDKNYFMYKEGMQGNYFCRNAQGKPTTGVVWPGRAMFPDFTDPSTRQWWAEKYPILINAGIAGFWHDMNEPSSFSAWGDLSLPLSTQHHFEGQTGDHLLGHNLYGLLMARAGCEGVRTYRPEKRPWFLTRAGWVGFQRYAWNWTGDIETSWEALSSVIPTVLGLSLSGQPYSGSDIGGFSGNPSPELFIRWFQLSAFLPFFRTHASITSQPREPWSFGEPYTTIARNYLQLRYRFLPYWYSLAWQASQTGTPIIKPLFWLDPSSTKFYNTDNAFLLGDALLVAPVLDESKITRNITFPPGQWYDFWSDTPYQAGESIKIDAALDKLPLFIRAGKIIPLQERDTLNLIVTIPESNSFSNEPALLLYSDSGDGFPDQAADYRVDSFYILLEDNHLIIKRQEQGEYPWPYRTTTLTILGGNPSQVSIDGVEAQINGASIETGLFNKVILKLL